MGICRDSEFIKWLSIHKNLSDRKISKLTHWEYLNLEQEYQQYKVNADTSIYLYKIHVRNKGIIEKYFKPCEYIKYFGLTNGFFTIERDDFIEKIESYRYDYKQYKVLFDRKEGFI